MKNTLADLNNYLFEQIERLNEDGQSPEQFEVTLKRSAAITKLATTIINSANVSLMAKKHFDEYGAGSAVDVPLLSAGEENEKKKR